MVAVKTKVGSKSLGDVEGLEGMVELQVGMMRWRCELGRPGRDGGGEDNGGTGGKKEPSRTRGVKGRGEAADLEVRGGARGMREPCRD